MKITNKIILLLVVAFSLAMAGCSGTKKVFCGCPNEQGINGFK